MKLKISRFSCFSSYKYGEDAFEFQILENEVPENKLNELENSYMETTQCRKRDFGYNIEPGFSAGRRSEETKQKISKSKKGKLSGLNSHTKEANDKRSKSLLGKKKNIKISKEEQSAIARANALKGVAKRRENSEYWSEYFRAKTKAWWANATKEEKERRCLQMKEGWKNKKN